MQEMSQQTKLSFEIKSLLAHVFCPQPLFHVEVRQTAAANYRQSYSNVTFKEEFSYVREKRDKDSEPQRTPVCGLCPSIAPL